KPFCDLPQFNDLRINRLVFAYWPQSYAGIQRPARLEVVVVCEIDRSSDGTSGCCVIDINASRVRHVIDKGSFTHQNHHIVDIKATSHLVDLKGGVGGTAAQ